MDNNKVGKTAYYDNRVVQKKMEYGIQKGALSITNSKFSAISKTSNSMNFNINVPSLNVFMSKNLDLTTEVILKFTLDKPEWRNRAGANIKEVYNQADPAVLNPVPDLGVDGKWAFNAYPIHQALSSVSATINDAVVNISTGDVLNELLMLKEADPNKHGNHTSPSYLSKYAFYQDGDGSHNNSISGFNDQVESVSKNGAYMDWNYCDVNGVLTGQPGPTYPAPAAGASAAVKNALRYVSTYTFYVKARFTESIMLSPFNFDKDKINSCGLFGVNNAQLTLTFKGANRMIQFAQGAGVVIPTSADVPPLPAYLVGNNLTCEFASSQPWTKADLNVNFLSPPLDMTLPKVSIASYMEFPRYITNINTPNPTATSFDITSSTFTLPSVPDYLVLYVKKPTYTSHENDYKFPISKVSIQFDNMAGICSTLTPEQLYQTSYENGLKMDWNTYKGKVSSVGGVKNIKTVGGFLCLKFGKDIPLQTGLASGVSGNFSLSLNLTCDNPTVSPVQNNDGKYRDITVPQLQLVVMTPTSGFFVTSSGSSGIHKNILTESDVMSAKTNTLETDTELERYIGGGFFDKLSSSASKLGNSIKSAVNDKGNQQMAKNMAISYAKKKLLGGATGAPAVSGGKVKLSKLL